MTEAIKYERPQRVDGGRVVGQIIPRSAAEAALDPRVSMVLAVLAGKPVDHVALDWQIDPSTLHRWVRDFVVAGSGAVTNRPDAEESRQRDRFLIAYAHELRTPMAVAMGWAMVLADGDVPEEQVSHSIACMSDALKRLSEHILDVELAASVSLGRLHVKIEPVEVVSLVRDLDGSPSVRHGGDLTVYADPQLLGRIVRDLWAVAHQLPAPESVVIDVIEVGSWHEIRVVRDGTQIGPLTLKAMFDPFGANDDATGVTLGLYLARALTVAHGGILGAEGDDDRTVLVVRLPRVPTLASDATKARSEFHQGEQP